MNLVPVSPTTPLPEIPREPGDSSLPEVAEDFANMLSLISLVPVTLAQPQPAVPTPATNFPEVTLPVQSDPSQIVPKAVNVVDTFSGVADSGDVMPSPAPPLQSSAQSDIEPDTGSMQPLTLPDAARRKLPLPNSTTLDEADVFGRTLPTQNEPPLLDPSDAKRTTAPVTTAVVATGPVTTAPVEVPSPIIEEPKKIGDTPSPSATAPGSLGETVTPALTSPVSSEQNQVSRIETISPKTVPTEIKPEPKPIAVINPEPKPSSVITAGPSKPEVLVNETTQREANIAASYLAEGTRERGESSPIAALKLQLSTNGFGAESQQNELDQKQPVVNKDVRGVEFQPLNMMTGSVVSREGNNESPVTQTVSHILQLAEATPPNQSRTVRLRLRPEELGQVDVQLSRDAHGRISAHLTVENDNARAVLAQSLEQLRDSLQRAGLEVDRLQVRAEVSSFSSGQGTNQRSQEESRVYQSSSLTNSGSATETHALQAKRVNDHKLISLSA